ncbi:MAG: hypothetical protein R2911_22455 [Caldilineaceae bacterium]
MAAQAGGPRGLSTRVISAIDIALWDLMGKIVNKPVYKLLGGYRDRIPAYIAGGYYEEGAGCASWPKRWKKICCWGPRPSK